MSRTADVTLPARLRDTPPPFRRSPHHLLSDDEQENLRFAQLYDRSQLLTACNEALF